MTWNLTVSYVVRIHFFCRSKILFGSYYRPPNTGIEYFELLRESFTAINNKFDKVFLAGLTKYLFPQRLFIGMPTNY